jgi:glycosidase
MKRIIGIMAGVIVAFTSCNRQSAPENFDPASHTDWSRNATIYEVNIRQYTPEGTFTAFEKELPRLQKMGIKILWLMPINPVGEKNRKGSLGSYYSVMDYKAVNPEFGSKSDFTSLVSKAHELGMKVIIDWVANHTAWDNNLIEKHPEWYKKDSTGKICPPVPDWTDVAALDYSQQGLREYMTDAMLYWIKETDIDGFRCDVAGMLPVSFWNEAVPKLKLAKPVFMLAEEESAKIHDSGYFDATYSWALFHAMNDIARGKKPATTIDSLMTAEAKTYPPDAYRMRFTSNHDENSWNGTEFERMGEGARAFAVLSFTLPGIPMIYSGQESAMNRRLRFFDKDTIPWGNFPLDDFYSKLTGLKTASSLLEAGKAGGTFSKIKNSADKAVYAFMRKSERNQMVVFLNLSGTDQTATLKAGDYAGEYTEAFTGAKQTLRSGQNIALKAWEYQVFVR